MSHWFRHWLGQKCAGSKSQTARMGRIWGYWGYQILRIAKKCTIIE